MTSPADEGSDNFLLVWLGVTLVTALALIWLLVWRSAVPGQAGRGDPESVFADPSRLITEPGLLGSAIELRVIAAVDACLAEQGLDVKGIAVTDSLDAISDPKFHGYGIARSAAPDIDLDGVYSPFFGERAEYEAAMYGGDLSGDTPGGCAAVGQAALAEAVATLDAMPYPIAQLERDLAADIRFESALSDWAACMSRKGHSYSSPEDAIASLQSQFAGLRGEEAEAFADVERRVATDDRECRVGSIDAVLPTLADDYGERFVEANREQLVALIPTAGTPPVTTGTTLPPDLGSGDVQVTLQWVGDVDVDLAVTDPDGSTISYSARTSPSGGELDRDANFPCTSVQADPVENVFWPPGGAPAGVYRATAVYRSSCGNAGPITYILTIRLDGRITDEQSGTMEPGETVSLEFSFAGSSG